MINRYRSLVILFAYLISWAACYGEVPQDSIEAPVTTNVTQGYAYSEEGQRQKAIDEYSKAIKLNAKNSAAYGLWAIEYLVLRRYDKAIADLNQAIRLDPKESKFYNYRGIAYEEQGQYQKAKPDYIRAVQLDGGGEPVEDHYEQLDYYEKINTKRQWTFNGFTCQPIARGLEIRQKGTVVYTVKRDAADDDDFHLIWLNMPLEGAKKVAYPECWDLSKLKPAKSPAIKMDKSTAPMFVIGHVGMTVHGASHYDFLSLGDKFKKIAELNDSNDAGSSGFRFVDFLGDGCCAAYGGDSAFLYWNAPFAESPQGTIILRLENGKFALAEDLMRSKLPDAEFISGLVKETRAQLESEKPDDPASWPVRKGLFFLRPIVWSNLIDLIYSGNGNEAWEYLRQLWPKDKRALRPFAPKETISRAEFIREFKDQLATSQYWTEIKHLNGWR